MSTPFKGAPVAIPGLAGARIVRTPEHVLLALPGEWPACGSAPLGGGMRRVRGCCILRVDGDANGCAAGYAPPEETLAAYCREQGWPDPFMGMMTAASMDSCRIAMRSRGAISLGVMLTAGIANARRAGDKADCSSPEPDVLPVGTINIVAATNAELTDAAKVEAVMIITEAKAAALDDLAVRSPVSGLTATGTGTDCAAIVCGEGPALRWCGKHVPFGGMLAGAVMEALTASLNWQRKET